MRDEEENHGEPPERPAENNDGSKVLADAARAINSPKLRSMRLIGDENRNPKYNWYLLYISFILLESHGVLKLKEAWC